MTNLKEIFLTFIDRGIPYDPLKKPDPDVTLSADEREIGAWASSLSKRRWTR